MTKLRPFWGVRPYGERVSFCFLIATILADKAAIISLWSPWQSKDIGADGIMLLVAVEPENTSRTVRCVLLYRAGGCCMLCVSHLYGQSRGCGETWNDYDPTHLRYTLMHEWNLKENARVKKYCVWVWYMIARTGMETKNMYHGTMFYPSHPNSTGQQKTFPTPKALSQLQLSMFCRKFGRK